VRFRLDRCDGAAATGFLIEILSFIQRIDAEVFCERSVPKYSALRVTFKKTVRGFYVPDNLESRYFIHTQYLVGSYQFRSVTLWAVDLRLICPSKTLKAFVTSDEYFRKICTSELMSNKVFCTSS
jgi:hypothetical protein